MGARVRYGTGGYAPGERWTVATPVNRPAGCPLVVVAHGAGGTGHSYATADSMRGLEVLAASGCVVIAGDLGSTDVPIDGWGNDNAVAGVDEVIEWAAAEWSCDTSTVALIGDSAGGATVLRWAWLNPTRAAAVVLRVGVPDIGAVYRSGNAFLIGLIDAAYGGTAGLDLPGTTGAYASTPNHAALQITGDLDARVDATADDWTPAAQQTLASKWTTAGNQRSWRFGLNTTGTLFLTTTPDGVTQQGYASTVAPTVANGGRLAVRVTLDVDNGAGGRTATFYTAPTLAGPWTQLGAPATTAGATSLHGGTAPVELGGQGAGTANMFAGILHAAAVRAGIDGTVVTDPDFAGEATGTITFTDPAGRPWTVLGAAAVDSPFATAAPTHDPAENTELLAPLASRIRFYYSTNDSLVPAASVTAAADAIGCRAISLGAVDHDPFPTIDNEAVSSFIRSGLRGTL